jgi:hypothetical protein
LTRLRVLDDDIANDVQLGLGADGESRDDGEAV